MWSHLPFKAELWGGCYYFNFKEFVNKRWSEFPKPPYPVIELGFNLGCLLSYRRLHKKSFQNLLAWVNTKGLLIHSFSAPEIQEHLSWRVLAHGLPWGCSPDVSRGCLIWELDWSWKVCFQAGSLAWLLAGDLRFSPRGSAVPLLECLHDMAVGFPSRWATQREKGRSHKAFGCLA